MDFQVLTKIRDRIKKMYEEIAQIYREFLIESLNWCGGDDPIDYSNESLTLVVGRSWLGDENDEQTLSIQRRDGVAFDEKMLNDLLPYIEKVDQELQEKSDKFDRTFEGLIADELLQNFDSESVAYFEIDPVVVFHDVSWSFKLGERDRLLGTIDVFNDGRRHDYKSKNIKDDMLIGAIGFRMHLGGPFHRFNLEWENDEGMIVKTKVVTGSEGDKYNVVTYSTAELNNYRSRFGRAHMDDTTATICSCPAFSYEGTCKHV